MDDRLAMAISHWAPRFTANGVTAADFDRITRDLPSWDEWCRAWSAVAAEHEQLGRDALKAGRTISAGEHLSQAAVYFQFAKFLFVSDLVQMRAAHERAVTCLTDALPYLDPLVTGSRYRSRDRGWPASCVSRPGRDHIRS